MDDSCVGMLESITEQAIENHGDWFANRVY